MKACRGFYCCVALAAMGGLVASVMAAPPAPGKAAREAISTEAIGATGSGSAAGFPKCESTGFEAGEAICSWDLGVGICGPTFVCRDTAVDGGYPACALPQPPNPDNCCFLYPHPINEWFYQGSSQHCQQPHVSAANPASGTQHLRVEHSAQGGNPAGCVQTTIGAGTNCRFLFFTANQNPDEGVTPLNPGVTTISFDMARTPGVESAINGMDMQVSNQDNTNGLLTQRWLFRYTGYVYAVDFAIGQYFFVGGMYGDGTYHNFGSVIDACEDTVTYSYDGMDVYTTSWSEGVQGANVEVFTMAGNNAPGAILDLDNFSVTRDLIAEPACPSICGDGAVEGVEQCDPGDGVVPGDDSCCPGLCGAVGAMDECQCPAPTNTLGACAGPELVNGVNGPFISSGGFYSYTADAPFTSVDTCASDFDSQIFWGFTADCAQFETFNDDCWNNDYAGTQQPGDPNASCYGGAAPPPGYQSCICNPTVPGETYTLLIAEWAPAPAGSTLIPPFCSSTVINITKKTGCNLGDVIPGGACCDQIAGTCTDGVEADACLGEFDVYSDNKNCEIVECVALTGACCNTAPGAGGACVETTSGDCPTSQYQSWTVNAACGDITCLEVTGSCCNTLSGTCSEGVTQGQCGVGADFVWTEGGTCSSCTARLGACCVKPDNLTAECSATTLAQCDAAGGVWSDSQDCANVECVPNFIPIPTVSEWGLAVLALMLLIGGKIYFSRREAAMA